MRMKRFCDAGVFAGMMVELVIGECDTGSFFWVGSGNVIGYFKIDFLALLCLLVKCDYFRDLICRFSLCSR